VSAGARASLRRTLTIRFAATMAAGLLLATGAFYWAATRALTGSLSRALLERDLVLVLITIVVSGTAATLMGAWRFTSSAVRPVAEITEQATHIEAGQLAQRIVAHADVEEYHGLVAVLNRMLERLDRAFVAQRRLTADVSHELRTPLTALRGEIEVALRAPRSTREYVDVLRSSLEEIDALTSLAEDLLLITRADARLLTPQRSTTDLEGLVKRQLSGMRERIRERELAVTESWRIGGQPVPVDEELLDRLVFHLLDNAVRYTPRGGNLNVTVEPLPVAPGVRIVVTNSGPGIAPGDLPHVFEPFYRSDPARTRTGGPRKAAGLGLAMVAAIARLHDGQVHATSVPGQTRFTVDLGCPPALAHTT